jgi:hypothetical protein
MRRIQSANIVLGSVDDVIGPPLAVLAALVCAIDVTGGCVQDESGNPYPVADPEWVDLVAVSVLTCVALRRALRIADAGEPDPAV